MLLSKFKICFFGFRLSEECPSVMSGIEFVQGSVVRNSGDVFVVSIKAKEEGGKSRTGIPSSNQRVIVELQTSLVIVMMF